MTGVNFGLALMTEQLAQGSNATARTLYDKVAKHQGFIIYTHEL